MSTMKIYLHIGAGKCASSSIQNYFSYHNVIGSFGYGCLSIKGDIISGENVKVSAALAPSNYALSYALNESITSEFINLLNISLDKLSKKHDTLLLSCEGWSDRPDKFESLTESFKKYDVSILFIVRPPVQWVNSAWWQWFQWEKGGVGVDSWVKNLNISKNWVEVVERFSSLEFIRKVHVISLNKDIMKYLSGIIGVHINQSGQAHNSASSGELLNFLRLKRGLKKGPHETKAEFILNKYLDKKHVSDWVLSPHNVELLLKNNRNYSKKLATLIENENIEDNKAWWSPDFYGELCSSYNRELELSYETLSSMLEDAYRVIISIDDELRVAKSHKIATDSCVTIIQSSNADELRDYALLHEKLGDIALAHKFMKAAYHLRPTGPVIKSNYIRYCNILEIKYL